MQLSVADWNGLVNAKVSLAQLQLQAKVGSIQQLLNTSLSISDFYALVLGAAGQSSLLSTLLGGVPVVGVNAAQATVSGAAAEPRRARAGAVGGGECGLERVQPADTGGAGGQWRIGGVGADVGSEAADQCGERAGAALRDAAACDGGGAGAATERGSADGRRRRIRHRLELR